jgi:hypothetical protein
MSVVLDTSLRFNPAKTSTHQAATSLAADLIQAIQHHRGKRFTRQPALYQQNLTTILLNLYAASMTPGKPWVAYSRNENDQTYRQKSRYNSTRLSYRRVTALLNSLMDLDLLETARGFYDPVTGVSRLSRMKASQELEDFFDAYGLTPRMTCHIRETIRLKNRQKKLVEYRDTPTTTRMRTDLDRINANLVEADIRLDCSIEELHALLAQVYGRNQGEGIKDFDRTSTTLYRVFNNTTASKPTLAQGGRFYGHWVQCLPSDYREKLLLDGQPVCELDFSGLSINMLYLREGLPMPEDDVYAVDGLDVDRGIMKGVLQRLLNAKDMKQAKQAIRDLLRDGDRELLPRVDELMQAFLHKHVQIVRYFGTGVGLELQRQDSHMANLILLRLLDRGITCVPVHDSFVVQAHHRHQLREAMEEVSEEVLGSILRIT